VKNKCIWLFKERKFQADVIAGIKKEGYFCLA
jgi:hypothetical protein